MLINQPSIHNLNNQFFIMRHGHSLANKEGIVLSDPAYGVPEYGLSATGIEQVDQSIDNDQALTRDTAIVSSDFRRARETAEIVHDTLACNQPIEFDERLRERFFGDHDRQSDTAYAEVWRQDRLNPQHKIANVESVNSVLARGIELVLELDTRLQEKTILLVSHGDILQILQTAFAKIEACRHRDIDHLETAEIRKTEDSILKGISNN